MATITYQEFVKRLDTLTCNIEELNRDCHQHGNLTAERARQCYKWAETQWLNAILANNREEEKQWEHIVNVLATA